MWTPEIIRARFVEAADTERRMPHRGISTKTGFWPEFFHTFEDMSGWGEKRLAEDREMRFKRLPPSSAAISRHDEVMQWTMHRIHDEKRRKLVWALAWCRLKGTSFSEVCKKQGWVRMTAYRRLAATFDAISFSLGNDGVLLRLPDEKWMLHEEQSGVSIIPIMDDCADEEPSSPPSFITEKSTDLLTSPEAMASFVAYVEKTNKRRRRALAQRFQRAANEG